MEKRKFYPGVYGGVIQLETATVSDCERSNNTPPTFEIDVARTTRYFIYLAM